MVTANPTPDGFVPTQKPHLSDAAGENAVIHKFKNLKIYDRSTFAEEGGGPDSVLLTRQFKGLDISGGSPGQTDNNSAQTTAAVRSHTHPREILAQMIIELEIQHPETPFDLPTNSIGSIEDDLREQAFEVDDFDDGKEYLAMRYAMQKRGKKRTRIAGKRLSKGPIRNKFGGVSRHRHNASHMNLAGW